MALSSTQVSVLQMADRPAIKSAIAQIAQHWSDSRWLARRNPYTLDCLKQIDRDSNSTLWAPTHVHLREYIAASSVTHCFDGWSFLGRAVDAELRGDPDTARHLAYYAELRAAMSLLAADGIGVFNNKHVVVDIRRRCHRVAGGGTHHFTWEALQVWASSPAGVNTLLNSIRPGGLPLSEWMRHYPASVNFIATAWLQQWGLDLSRLADDREARNLASYRPTAFTSPGPTEVIDTTQAATKLWEMCEPGASGGFPVLDRHLLRRAVELAFKTSQRRARLQARRKYENDVRAMLHGVAPTELSQAQWEQFLKYEDNPAPPRILLDADGRSRPTALNHSKEVLARATLLLRVATGSVAELLRDVTVPGGTELRFWWSQPAVRRSIWPDGSPPNAFADLWLDIRDAADAIENWGEGDSPHCFHSLWNERGKEAGALATIERVALWGLGL